VENYFMMMWITLPIILVPDIVFALKLDIKTKYMPHTSIKNIIIPLLVKGGVRGGLSPQKGI